MDIDVRLKGARRVEATVHGRTIVTDQPPSAGGKGSAPAPFDLFLASIATCAGFYVYDFCANRDIPTDGLSLVMHTEKNPETRMIERVVIEIQLPGTFPEKYEKAIVRAAELCSVKKHLENPPFIETRALRVA